MNPIIKRILNFKKSEIPEYEKHLMLAGGSPGPNLIKGKNIYVWDIDGNKYIDCTSQAWALNLGYTHPKITEIVREQIEYSIGKPEKRRSQVFFRSLAEKLWFSRSHPYWSVVIKGLNIPL